MGYAAFFPLLAATLIGSASLPQRASAQSNPYALDRLFLDASNITPFNEVLSFNSAMAVDSFYGADSTEAHLASDFFSGYTGSSANMLFARFQPGGGRARLFGSSIGNPSSPHYLPLSSLREINNDTLSLTSQGYNFSASINLSGVQGYSAAAASIQNALNANLPRLTVTTGSSIASALVQFSGSLDQYILTVGNVSLGSLQIGSIISGMGIPKNTQITTQISGTPNGAGTYAVWFTQGINPSAPLENMTDSYGILTVPSGSEGVKAGQQVTGAGVLPYTAIQALFSGGSGNTWVVDTAQDVAVENMTMTAAPLSVTYRSKGSKSLWIEAYKTFNVLNTSISYAVDTAAATDLGLTLAAGADDSTPGQVVTSPSAFMDNLTMSETDQFSSFQTTFVPSAVTKQELRAWDKSTGDQYEYIQGYSINTPPIVDSVGASSARPLVAVPEPSTWAMMLLGLAGLGFVGYRRTRTTAAVAPRSDSRLVGFRRPSQASICTVRGVRHLGTPL
jgi:Protein of unknown function (DUF3383)/PEP-CTERM motif